MVQAGVTDDQLNKLWHEYKGGCVHELRLGAMSGIYCPKCDREWNSPKHIFPDHVNDPAVFRECVVKYELTIYPPYKDPDQVERWTAMAEASKNHFFVARDPDPQRAAMMAVLKMKGVE